MKIFIAIVIIAVIGLGGWYYTSQKDGETATTTPEVATTTDTTIQTPVMEDGAGGPEAVRGAYMDGTYSLNVDTSSVAWVGSKTLIKNYKDDGTLSFTAGSVVVSNGNVTGGNFTIDMNSLEVSSTSNTKATSDQLEGHLKSEDFFEVETYPTATIALKNVINGIVTADVTIKGVTKTISFPATIAQEGNTLNGSAKLTIDRTLWNLQYGSTKFFGDLGNNVIDDKVELTLTLHATK